MNSHTVTCVICPVGCEITVDYEGTNVIEVKGNKCKRGYDYASAEVVNPVRILTTTVKLKGLGHARLAVRSSKPVPKTMLMQCMEEINKVTLTVPAKMGDIIIPDILGTGADIIAASDT